MFSVTARERLLKRGWSVPALLAFVRDSAAESVDDVRVRPRLARAVVRFAATAVAVEVALVAPLYAVHGMGAALVRFAVWTALGGVGFTLFVLSSLRLMRTLDGRPVDSVGPANYLTIVRFLLIVPMLVLFDHGFKGAALAAYITLGLTDIADGMVARRRGEGTEFGVVMDPLGDVFSTAAIFSLFLARGLVPLWVFALLMARYTMLIAGSFALFLMTGPIRFRSTVPGKVVGLVQGAGAVVITVCAMVDHGRLDAVGPVVFPILGAGFASIVVSQAVIGLRHIRSAGTRQKAVEVES